MVQKGTKIDLPPTGAIGYADRFSCGSAKKRLERKKEGMPGSNLELLVLLSNSCAKLVQMIKFSFQYLNLRNGSWKNLLHI